MVGEPNEAGEPGDKKLPEAKSVRELGMIIDDAGAMTVFRAAGGTLTRALARFESEHPQEWLPAVSSAENVLASLSPDILRKLSEEELATLQKLRSRVDQVLEDRKRLRGE